MDFFDLTENGQGAAVDYDRFYLDVAGLEHLQDVPVTGLAAHVAAIADDEDYFPASAITLAEVQAARRMASFSTWDSRGGY